MTLQGKVGESGLSVSHPSTRRDLQGTWKLCSQGSEATGEEGQLRVLAVAKLALPWQAGKASDGVLQPTPLACPWILEARCPQY